MWLGDDAQGGARVGDDGDMEPDGLDSPPYALTDEVDDDPDGADWADEDWDDEEWADDEWADEEPAQQEPAGDEPAVDQPEDEPEDEAPRRRLLVPAFALGAVVGMLLLGLVWGATAMFGGSEAPADKAPTAGTNPDAQQAAATSAAPSRPSRMERCQRADAALTAPLQAASAAMDQWEVHIGAMNKLVVGAISLQQANDFWNQTRVGAQRHLDRFRKANRAVPRMSCPAPARVRHADPALRSCVRRVAADQRELAAARTTLATWAMHVKDMEMLRMGHMTPAAATQMWLASWHSGTRQLHAYRDAEAAVAGAGRC